MKIKLKDKEAFRALIIKSGFTNSGLAKSIGFTGPHVNNVVNGHHVPSPKMAKMISDALGVEFDEIFFIEDERKILQK